VELAAYQSPKTTLTGFWIVRRSPDLIPDPAFKAGPSKFALLCRVRPDFAKIEIGRTERIQNAGPIPVVVARAITIPWIIVALPLELYFFSSFGDARAPSGKEKNFDFDSDTLNNNVK